MDSTYVPTFFVFMVYAIGSQSSAVDDHASAEGYYTIAMQYLEPILEIDGLESIQALLAIGVFSARSPYGVSLWKISGMAMRLCVQLGYHRSTEKYRRSGDSLTKEMSKRCFWVAYDFDRYTGSILGLPGAISDQSIDVELPLDVDDEQITPAGILPAVPQRSPTTMTGTIHLIKLRQIWSKFSTHLFPTSSLCSHGDHVDSSPTIEELREQLEQWRASAPTIFDQPSDTPLSVFASRGWFHVAYNHSILLLYRHYLMDTKPYKCSRPLPRTPEIVDRAYQESHSKARDLCLIYRRLYQNPCIKFTWSSLHMTFYSGLTYLYCLWRSKSIRDAAKQRDVFNTLNACQTVLVVLAERWKLAASYRDLFETLSERTISMMSGDLDQEATPGTATGTATATHDDAAGPEPVLAAQDWSNGFDGMDLPPESEWMISEMVQGVQDADANIFEDFTNVEINYDFLSEDLQIPSTRNNGGVM
ncbi:uncharacterized protein LTR77_005711 [Saxophila tyrrhenica]|uniref:Xylanolytic transcriptional activator regulatory domain-containing protein n=1 Tax=Saxophila tyrrhenica TaxID=1690608 RepID=A0AAV9P9C2_9PEZI|nr:hypothetical protein LTR77_005711 [Saxophila tyrrhenica]